MTDHKCIIHRKGTTLIPLCSCGWHGKRSSFGNNAGYGYATLYAAGSWWEHVKGCGYTLEGDQARDEHGELIATFVGRLDYRVARSRFISHPCFASREYALAEACSGWMPYSRKRQRREPPR